MFFLAISSCVRSLFNRRLHLLSRQVADRKAAASSQEVDSARGPRRRFVPRQNKPVGHGGPSGWRRCRGVGS